MSKAKKLQLTIALVHATETTMTINHEVMKTCTHSFENPFFYRYITDMSLPSYEVQKTFVNSEVLPQYLATKFGCTSIEHRHSP